MIDNVAARTGAVNYHDFSPPSPRAVPIPVNVYVHVPFCSRHCWYCDFNVYDRLGHLIRAYFEALLVEIRGVASVLRPTVRVEGLYVGGGTPSLAGPRLLAGLFRTLADCLELGPSAEATVEVNPSNVSPRVFDSLLAAGFNRISIGVQSLSDARLADLDRLHSARAALQAIDWARAAGFPSVSADLLYGIPGQSLTEWSDGLRQVVDSGVDHVSAYALTLYTERAERVARGLGGVAADDDMTSFYEAAVEVLAKAGFGHYEVSNWARPGHECRYNSAVWQGGQYLGFGCGAHGFFAARRYSLIRSPVDYMGAVRDRRSVVERDELLSPYQRVLESIAFPLRTRQGVDADAVHRTHGFDLLAEKKADLEELRAAGLLEVRARRVALTDKGMFLCDAVAARLTPDVAVL